MLSRISAPACALIGALLWAGPAAAANGAAFVSQNVPGSVQRGSTFAVEVTLQNTGDTTWTGPAGHCLGSESPRDNLTWGTNRMFFADQANDSVAPGASYTFRATLTAPATEGDYTFQWQMLQDAVEWFGATSALLTIHVTAPPPFTCDGTEVVCLDLTSAGAVSASGGSVVGGDFNAQGFMPSNQGGIDWDFGAGRDFSAGEMEVLVTGLQPLPGDEGSGGKVSIFDFCGTGGQEIEGVGLQKMDESYRDGHIFRFGMDDDGLADNWDAAIITGAGFGMYYSINDPPWQAGETHKIRAAWSRAGLELWIDSGTHFTSGGNGDTFDPVTKVFTLAARCTHYANQQAIARFSNFRLWAKGTCGNGSVDSGETCDGNCPTSCADANACTADSLSGNAATCNASCVHDPITACAGGDGCCPAGCTSATDADCPATATCGNGKIDSGETCDGNCPASCDDSIACTADTLTGSAASCTAACAHLAVTACASGDGCCPAGCAAASDSDCTAPATCGNGKVDTGEACDGNCPTACDDANACTADALTGSAATCSAACSHSAITACGSEDGCCPAGCTTANDPDCENKPLPPTGTFGACGCGAGGAPVAAWLGAWLVVSALARRRSGRG